MIKYRTFWFGRLSVATLLWLSCLSRLCLALPPANDTPEEILRTEIILEGRSPIDGQALSASEYQILQTDLSQSSLSPQVDPDIRQLIFLLQLRKLIKTIIPFY
ncbi:MAG: hypothetical protein AAFQ41_09850 [Cyanobacteria bacterium J06623_7]